MAYDARKDQEFQIALLKLKEDYYQKSVAEQNKMQEQLKSFKQSEEQIRAYYEDRKFLSTLFSLQNLTGRRKPLTHWGSNWQRRIQLSKKLRRQFTLLRERMRIWWQRVNWWRKEMQGGYILTLLTVSLTNDVYRLTTENGKLTQGLNESTSAANTYRMLGCTALMFWERQLQVQKDKLREVEYNLQQCIAIKEDLETKLQSANSSSASRLRQLEDEQKDRLQQLQRIVPDLKVWRWKTICFKF